MCGIAGLWRPGGGDESLLVGYVGRMTEAIGYRGPDASGLWSCAKAGVAFGHRRLSILDLSEAGAQPMRSACGRLTVTFNGDCVMVTRASRPVFGLTVTVPRGLRRASGK